LGNFQFDSLLAILFEVEPNPFTDTPFGVLAVGTLSGGGFDPTLTLLFSLFDEDGTYGEAGFSLATASFLDATAIPEPPGLLLACLALGALAWLRRRAHA
jgi:MYXO-CTERM domain-containing protein